MKKKWLSLVLTSLVLVSFSGCGSDNSNSEDSSATGVVQNTVVDENSPPSVPTYPYRGNTPPSIPTQTN